MQSAAARLAELTPDVLAQASRLRRAHRLTNAQERVLRNTTPGTWRRTDASLGTLHALVDRDLAELRLNDGCVEFRLTMTGEQLRADLERLVGHRN